VASLFTFQPAINKSSTVTHAQERLLVSQVWILVNPPDLQWCHFNLHFHGDMWCGVFSIRVSSLVSCLLRLMTQFSLGLLVFLVMVSSVPWRI
jgi:hypothetical protein